MLAISMGIAVLISAAEALTLDTDPAAFQKPYTPADGAVVSVNPPPFIWVPPQDDLSYVIEVSRTPDFAGETIRREGIPISTVALTEPLEPGPWHWRYGVERGDGDILYSRTRAFTVPGDVPRLPYPDVEAAMRGIPEARPRMFILNEQVEAYRDRAREGDLKPLCDALLRACDRALGEDLVPEPPYVTGTGPERGRNYMEIFRSTRPPMDHMERCGLAYLMTGDRRYGEEARRRVLHFFGWDPEGSTSYRNNDEPAMWVMMRGVRAYDWTYDLYTPEEREAVEACMRIRADQFFQHLKYRRRFHTNPFESHAGRTIGFLGEAALCFAHEWPEAREWLDYVMTIYWNVYPAWGREDGGWHEGPSYWTAYMSFALHFVAPLRVATGVDLMRKPFFRNTPYYLLYTNPPYARTSPFGDGESGGSVQSRGSLMYTFSTLLQDPYIRWYADAWNTKGGADVLGMVFQDDTLEARHPSELPPSRHFPGVGLVSLHTALGDAENDIHFLIKSTPYGAVSHGHAEQNSFVIEAFGEALAIESGYYPWYGSDHHAKWVWESKSSNTITFDGGIGQVIRDPRSKGAITAFEPGEHFDYVEADATEAYQGRLTRFVRRVVHLRPGVFVVCDEVAAPEPVTFEWRLHSLSEMALDTGAGLVTVAQGDARMRVTFVRPEAVVLTQTTGFEFPPERGELPDQFHLVASPPEKAATARYLTVLVPYRAGTEDALPRIAPLESGFGARIEDARGACFVAFRDGDGDLVAGPTSGKGDVIAVRVDTAGEPTATFHHPHR